MFTASLLGLATLAPAAPVPAAPAPNPVGAPVMGVRADTNTCVITEVYPGLPAGKAGVRAGDRIVRVGNLEPIGFAQVYNHIQTYRPGAVVELEVDRNGTRETFRLRLATRPPDFETTRPYPSLPGFPND